MKKTICILLILITLSLYFQFRKFPHLDKNELAGFPIIQQPDNISCGPTSVAMVLKYYNKEVTIDEVKKYTKTNYMKMTLPNYIKVALDKMGVNSAVKIGDLDELKYYVDKNCPPIVLLRSAKKYWHYVVVIGYTEKEIILANPSGEKHSMSNDDFLNSWNFEKGMNLDKDEFFYNLFNLTDISPYTLIVPTTPKN